MITRVLIEAEPGGYRVEVHKDGTLVSAKMAPDSIHRALEIAKGEVTFSPTAESVRAAQEAFDKLTPEQREARIQASKVLEEERQTPVPGPQPVQCPMGTHPIFVRPNGSIVAHYGADGKRCPASEKQYPWKDCNAL